MDSVENVLVDHVLNIENLLEQEPVDHIREFDSL
jgi:hypothetical protein